MQLEVKQMKYILLIVIVFSYSMNAYSNELINIPCPNYKKGDIFTSTNIGDMYNIKSKSIVQSVTNDSIVIISSYEMFGRKSTFEQTLIKKGDNLFTAKTKMNNGGMKVYSELSPPEPLCGEIPASYSFLTKVSGTTNSPPLKTTVKLKKVGNKKLVLPLGNLMTTVIHKNSNLVVQAPNAIETKQISTLYYADKYGLIKSSVTMISLIPDFLFMEASEEVFTKDNMKFKEQKTSFKTQIISYKQYLKK